MEPIRSREKTSKNAERRGIFLARRRRRIPLRMTARADPRGQRMPVRRLSIESTGMPRAQRKTRNRSGFRFDFVAPFRFACIEWKTAGGERSTRAEPRSIAGARVRNASRAPNGTGRRGRSSARRRMSEPAARSPPAREAGDAGRANAAAPRRRERPASAICNTRTRAGLTYINDRACDAAPQRRRPPIVAPCTGAAALTWLNARGHARRMLVHTCFACCSRGSPARSSDAARQAPDVPTAP